MLQLNNMPHCVRISGTAGLKMRTASQRLQFSRSLSIFGIGGRLALIPRVSSLRQAFSSIHRSSLPYTIPASVIRTSSYSKLPSAESLRVARESGIYSGDIPTDGVYVDPRLQSYFEVFYNFADNCDNHEVYATDFFTEDATVILGSRRAHGTKEIAEVRLPMWTGWIESRQHTLLKIFTFGNNSKEVMLQGICTYTLANGTVVPVDWAGRASFQEVDGELKMKYYQVYLDSALLTNAAEISKS